MYRIDWKSKVTGATGSGKPVFTLEMANYTAYKLNSKSEILVHSVSGPHKTDDTNDNENDSEKLKNKDNDN